MDTFKFSGNAQVEIQGARVLQLEDQFVDFVEFKVIGFGNYVIIRDYRLDTLTELDAITSGKSKAQFTDSFCRPAFIDVDVDRLEQIRLELWPSIHEPVDHVLWIAVGLSNHLPVLNYLMRKIVPFEKDKFAVVSLASKVVDKCSRVPTGTSIHSPSRSFDRSEPVAFVAGS